jgi:hypothetical protein
MATTMPDSANGTLRDRTPRVLARFTGPPAMTSEKYDETVRRLETMDNWPPDGLAYHVAFHSQGKFRVSEVWDSREQFNAFSKRLMQVLKNVGIELDEEPETLEVHNTIQP